MATVFDVASYILDKKGTMTTMKLEKLTYYCQAWSLAWDGVPLFQEEFEAWANGPVCPELFDRHRGKFEVGKELFTGGCRYQFTEEQLETIDSVLDYYGDRDSHYLSELTHKESPWKEARTGISPGERCNVVISKDSMQQYYAGL